MADTGGWFSNYHDNYYHVVLCRYCNGSHYVEACPRVEGVEYYPNGTVKRVRLREPEPAMVTVNRHEYTAE